MSRGPSRGHGDPSTASKKASKDLGGGRMGAGIARSFAAVGSAAINVKTAAGLAVSACWAPIRESSGFRLDVRRAVADCLHETLGDRFAPPRLLREVARGEVGEKAGQGFCGW
ncbi:hypothetical protein [Streptomyces sp. NBC_00631]|uniref:hypothetical protein n=1 Tax=Streptomyces sp. NBC_00631 TaxID=2975793 RepID=UPI00386792A9